MRLALLLRRWSDQGGTERFSLGFARWLIAQGHSVHVWCAEADAPLPGGQVHALQAGGRGRIWRMLSLLRAARAVPRGDYDAVIGLSRVFGVDLYRAGGGCHRAWVARNGWSLADLVETWIDRRAVLGARLVVANSAMAGAQLVQRYGLPSARLRVIHNGVDLERFQPRPALQQAPLLGRVPQPAVAFLGNGYARKGLLTALQTIAALPGLHLAVIGQDAREAQWRRRAARLGVADRVHWLGQLARPEQALPAARALLLPTRYDPFANATLEAMAAGVPPVTSLENGASEVLPEPWLAVARCDDHLGFAQALERALQDPLLPAACRAAAEAHPAEAAYAALAGALEELSP